MILKKIKFVFLFYLLIVIGSFAYSQELTKIIQPSPTATQLQKYGDYPVGYTTGIPDIEIPLYMIKAGDIEVPISLSYHASGFRPDENNGIIGFGWTLNAGGRVSRTIIGKADEMNPAPYPFRTASQLDVNNSTDRDYISALAAPEDVGKEAEYDIFNFNAYTLNGRFILKNTGQNQRAPITLPFKPVKITSNSNLSFNSPITYFEIIDETGKTYRFGKSVANTSQAIETSTPDVKNSGENYSSSWLLREIISANKADTVFFKYDVGGIVYKKSRNDLARIETSLSQTNPDVSTSFLTSSHSELYVSEINFKNGKIVFSYNTAMQDLSLSTITILNLSGTILKNFTFNKSYFGPNPATVSTFFKLDNVESKDGLSAIVNRYVFEYYNSTASVPQNIFYNTAIDFYGYYNGHTENINLLPNWTLPMDVGQSNPAGNANRTSDEGSMQTYMLKKITYPTGGSTEFTFEANHIAGQLVGGLRIEKIANTSTSNHKEYKVFKYGINELGNGNAITSPTPDFFSSSVYEDRQGTLQDNPTNYFVRFSELHSNFVDGSGAFENSPIYYSLVTEYSVDENNLNTGNTLYEYNLPSPNGYSHVPFAHYLTYANPWNGGELKSKKVYRNTGTAYNLVLQEDYIYNKRQTESLQGVKIVPRFMRGHSQASEQIPNIWNLAIFTGLTYEQVYYITDYTLTSGADLLQQKTKTEIDNNGNQVTNTETYTYSSLHNFPITTTFTNSKGQAVQTSNKYPTDITLTGLPEDARQKLVSRNILFPLLQSKTLVGGVSRNLVNNNYKDFGNNMISPSDIQVQTGSGPLETRMFFNSYDSKGNLLEQQKDDDIKHSYV